MAVRRWEVFDKIINANFAESYKFLDDISVGAKRKLYIPKHKWTRVACP